MRNRDTIHESQTYGLVLKFFLFDLCMLTFVCRSCLVCQNLCCMGVVLSCFHAFVAVKGPLNCALIGVNKNQRS